MANPLFDLIKAVAKSATGTTVGKTTTAFIVITVSGTAYKLYHDKHTGDIVGAEVVERTVAKNDAQGDIRVKMEGLKDAPKDADAEKAATEAAARAAEEAAKAKEAETAKLEEALKAQKEAEEAAALAEQQAQEQNGENFADEEQNPDDLKDENADEGNGEGDTENEADDDEKGPDTYRGGNDDDDGKTDESGNPIETGNSDENNDETKDLEGKEKKNNTEGNETQKTENNNENNEEGQGEEFQEEDGTDKKKNNDGKKETQKTENNNENNEGGQGEEFQEEDGTDKKKEGGKNNTKNNEEGKGQGNETTESNNNNNNNQTSTKVENNNDSNDNVGDGEPSEQYKHVKSSFNNDNLGTTVVRERGFVAPSLEEARRAFLAKCKQEVSNPSFPVWLHNIDDVESKEQTRREAVKWLGKRGGDSKSQFIDGVAWAVYEAAAVGLKELGVSSGVLETEFNSWLEGIRVGLVRILNASLSLSNDGFSVQTNFTMSEAGVSADVFRRWVMSDYANAPYELHIKKDGNGCVITLVMKQQQTPQVDPAEAAKQRLLQRFRENEIAHVYYSDYESPGIAWAVQAAMTDSKSIVKELVFDEIKSAGKDFKQIGVGIENALSPSGQLRRDVYSIKVGFKLNKDALQSLQFDSSTGSWSIDGSERRIFVYNEDAQSTFNGELIERFKKPGDSYVDEWKLEFCDMLYGEGLKELLCFAAKPESKVGTLYLRTGNGNGAFFVKGRREKELEEALKEICAMKKINEGLKIKTNLRFESGSGDMEDRVNEKEDVPYAVLIDGVSGTVSFGRRKGGMASAEAQSARQAWSGMENNVLTLFKEGGNKSWSEICSKLSEIHGPSAPDGSSDSSSWERYFRQFGVESSCIRLAAHPDSRVEMLELGDVQKTGFLGQVKKVLEQDKIHPFKLYVSGAGNGKWTPEALFKEIESQEWWKSRKCELTFENDMFVFANKEDSTSSRGTTTTTTLTTGGGARAVKKINIDEAKLEALEKEFGKAETQEFGFLKEVHNQSFLVYGMPCIYAYQFFNDCDDGKEGKSAVDLLKRDRWVIDEIFDPTEAGFDADTLVLKATCYYIPGRYADGARTLNTRNYFLHTWIRNWRDAAEGDNVFASTRIVRSQPASTSVVQVASENGNCDGSLVSVSYHDGKAMDAHFSPDNCIFRFENNANAWFISEFDLTKGNPQNIAFPDVTGKRAIAIHWTFVEDNDGSRFAEAERKAKASGNKTLLPCQFSPNAADRSMDAVNEYLRLKKEKENIPLPPNFDELNKKQEEEWKKQQEEWKKQKEERDLLRRLKAARNKGFSFQLGSNVLNDDTFDKALTIGEAIWFEVSVDGANEVAKFFKKRFVDGNNNTFDKVLLDVRLDNDDFVDTWMAFKTQMDKAFDDKGKKIFVHLDKKNNKIWFVKDNDMTEKEKDDLSTKLPPLQVDKGNLEWTDELKAWWRNPANSVKTFAAELAETPGLKEVDFKESYEHFFALFLFDDCDYNSEEWKAFRDDEVLHRYRKNNAVEAFYGCSGVKFTFVPKENDDAFKQAIIGAGFYDGADVINLAHPTWSVTVEDKCRFVEDNGKNRLLWNNRAMELLEDAKSANGKDASKDAFEKFANEVCDAKTGGSRTFVDFTVKSGVSSFDILREACECKELWDALKVKFGNDDSCTFICPEEIKDVDIISGMNLPGFLRKEGWKVKHNTNGSFFKVTGKRDAGAPVGGAPAGEEEDLDLGGLF